MVGAGHLFRFKYTAVGALAVVASVGAGHLFRFKYTHDSDADE